MSSINIQNNELFIVIVSLSSSQCIGTTLRTALSKFWALQIRLICLLCLFVCLYVQQTAKEHFKGEVEQDFKLAEGSWNRECAILRKKINGVAMFKWLSL